MTANDPAAALSAIRGRGYRNGARGAECARLSDAAAEDIPSLVKALEAVLKLPAEWRQESEALRDAAGKVWEDAPDAAGVRLKHAYAAGYAECAKVLEAAITRELAGEEITNGR